MSAKRFLFWAELDRAEPVEVRVTYSVTPHVPATHWQPAEGLECEIEVVKGEDGHPVNTTEEEDEYLLRLAEERCRDDLAEDAAAEADWRYQDYRDRILMEKWERDQ